MSRMNRYIESMAQKSGYPLCDFTRGSNISTRESILLRPFK